MPVGGYNERQIYLVMIVSSKQRRTSRAAELFSSPGCPIVVGRAHELGLVERFLDDQTEPVLVISGEAGIGKSRLVSEASGRAFGRGLRVLHGTCFEPDRSLPYAPLIDLLREEFVSGTSVGENPLVQASTVALRQLLPEMTASFPLRDPASASEPAQHQKQVFYELLDLFVALSRDRPLLLIFEDLHWSDETSLEFLAYLARHAADEPIRLLLSFRSDEPQVNLSHIIAGLQRERIARELVLGRLTRDNVTLMVEAILGATRPPRELLDALFCLTEGNPFF
ncbi:MAG TPA: AAA family ATPase, partial [Chloroflexota bacterium]|nr:AAA family ATPase [Chloroflexota bacterium]